MQAIPVEINQISVALRTARSLRGLQVLHSRTVEPRNDVNPMRVRTFP
jgi:hypothetical protein